MARPDVFKFQKMATVGAADAEDDTHFLQECFVDTGVLTVIRDCSDPRRIILGRTGSGKTALLLRLDRCEEHVIRIKPESLSLSYISNSTILTFLSRLGVSLDIFFRLLWRHILTVEILKHHFHIDSEKDKTRFLEWVSSHFQDKKHKNALEYLEKWGKSFWEETEHRIREVTTTLEKNVEASITSGIPGILCSAEGADKMSEEQKKEVIHRAQRVVNEVQIRQLSEIIDLIDDILNDPKQKYYLIIDRLDEDWIDDALRYRLIRALIETVRDFKKVQNAKIVIALRLDLLQRVFRLTRDAGFQEEKYQSLCVNIEWKKPELVDALNRRVNQLVRSSYTTRKVDVVDILPRQVDKKPALDYLLERTFMRPRDLILFFNYCIDKAVDSPSITAQMIRDAEAEYSTDRLHSLADEWSADYPLLERFCDILRKRPVEFALTDISDNDMEDFFLQVLINKENQELCPLSSCANEVMNGTLTPSDAKNRVICIFFTVGLVGVKLESSGGVLWASSNKRTLLSNDVTSTTRIMVHRMFWRALGIIPRPEAVLRE